MEYFKHILQHANSYGSRSSILSPWIWMIGTLLAAISLCLFLKGPKELLFLLSVLVCIVLLCAIVAYFHCLFKGNTDALRSEQFNIEKLAIEKQVSSDSLTGIQAPSKNNNLPAINGIGESVEDVDA